MSHIGGAFDAVHVQYNYEGLPNSVGWVTPNSEHRTICDTFM